MLSFHETNCFLFSIILQILRLSLPKLHASPVRKALTSKFFPANEEMINEFNVPSVEKPKRKNKFTTWFKRIFSSKVTPKPQNVESKDEYFGLLHTFIDSLNGNKNFFTKFGIFRISATKAKEIFAEFKATSIENRAKNLLLFLDEQKPQELATLLKFLLLNSPHPIIPPNSASLMLEIMKLTQVTEQERIHMLKMALFTLGSQERLLLEKLLSLLTKISAHSERNKMNSHNLGIIFSAVLFVERDESKRKQELLNLPLFAQALELLIDNA